MNDNDPGHGHSPAAWTAVIIMLIAFTGGTVAFFFDVAWLVWAFAALAVIGLLAGVVLGRLGYGARGPRYAPKPHA